MRQKWGLYLGRNAGARGKAGGKPLPLETGADFVVPVPNREALADLTGKTRSRFPQQILACNCGDPVDVMNTFAEAGVAAPVHTLDLNTLCYAVHPEPEAARDKAQRLIAAAMFGAEARPPLKENVLTAENRLLLFTDAPEGLALAKTLDSIGQLVVFIPSVLSDGGNGASMDSVNLGELAAVEGRLGAFTVTVTGGKNRKTRELSADQVVVAMRNAPPVSRRTGLHQVNLSDSESLKALPDQIQMLIGTFQKPEHVTYRVEDCAGGSAENQTCGLCITYCPYQAVSRNPENPLRILVDHLTCEGCGACASACPTSALRFTEPATGEVYARLAALLAPGVSGAPSRAVPPPRPVVVFHCGEQGQRLLETAAREGHAYSSALLPVAVPCLRFVSESHLLGAMHLGASGVALLGCEACPNGERELLLQKLELTGIILEAFGLGRGRVRLFTTTEPQHEETLTALNTFGESLTPSPLASKARPLHATGNREVVAEVIAGFIGRLGKEVGGLKLSPQQPYAFAGVDEDKCTLCRACATACPSHALIFDPGQQNLQYKHIACVGCGLCETVCPEKAVTLRRELYLEKDSLEYLTVAQDEMISCAKCAKPYINRRALETIEARVLDAAAVLDTFMGARRNLLRMCPDCRAVAAMQQVQQGWEP